MKDYEINGVKISASNKKNAEKIAKMIQNGTAETDTEIVSVTCYYETHYMLRSEAKKFYQECMGFSEGCERQRYENLYFQLDEGLKECDDEKEFW